MFSHNGNVLRLVKIQKQGGYEGEFFCFYRYKEECEPEANKKKWKNPEDRWYEDYMTQTQIQQAIDNGAEFIDEQHIFKIHECNHHWITIGFSDMCCNQCGVNYHV